MKENEKLMEMYNDYHYQGYIYKFGCMVRENNYYVSYSVVNEKNHKEFILLNKMDDETSMIEEFANSSTSSPILLFTVRLALEHHHDQLDKGGNPYMNHISNVGIHGDNLEEQIVGFLHDIIEDTDCSLELLRQCYPDNIVNAVEAISRRKDEEEESYFHRIKENPIAVKVKIHDLLHNINFARMNKKYPNRKDCDRLIKYANEIKELMECAGILEE